MANKKKCESCELVKIPGVGECENVCGKANNPEQQYEEKKRELFDNEKNREIGVDNRIYAYTLNKKGIDELEQLALSEGKRQKTLEVIGIADGMIEDIKNTPFDNHKIKALEELKSKIKQQEE